ncbi:MAG: hypothetical protein R2788_13685 [Saprospiraceae bacterium]
MNNSRLIELISTFDKKEIREIGQFLASPFFNHREDVRQLFALLAKQEKTPSKEEAADILFPDQPFDPQQVRFVMSWLQKQLEDYLVVKSAFAGAVQTKAMLARCFRERGLERHFTIAARAVEEMLESQPLRNADHYFLSGQLARDTNLAAAKKQRTGDQHLQQLTDQHDAYYLIEKLRHACLIRSHQAVNKMGYDLGLLHLLLPHIAFSFWEKWPAAEVYYRCFQMLDEPDGRPSFELLKTLLEQHRHIFPDTELRDIYLFAINFSIRQLNGGDVAFAAEAFGLYRVALGKGLLTLDGHLSRFAYRNIVAIGLQMKEFDWVENFLMEQKDNLEAQHREATFSFNFAKLEYERKNFDAAILLLQKADYKDVLLNLAAKTLLLKIFYEQDELRLLDSHLAAMRRFVKRKKIIGYHQENYLNIITLTQKLVEVNRFDKKEMVALRQTIEEKEVLTEREWLLEKVAG